MVIQNVCEGRSGFKAQVSERNGVQHRKTSDILSSLDVVGVWKRAVTWEENIINTAENTSIRSPEEEGGLAIDSRKWPAREFANLQCGAHKTTTLATNVREVEFRT